MRKLMICASALLALLQVWPMVFGRHDGSQAVASVPQGHLVPAVATVRPIPVKASVMVPESMPKGCYAHYRLVFAACTKGDRTCQLHAADQWDLCEATGAWPE
jgi:hypothetical protein